MKKWNQKFTNKELNCFVQNLVTREIIQFYWLTDKIDWVMIYYFFQEIRY